MTRTKTVSRSMTTTPTTTPGMSHPDMTTLDRADLAALWQALHGTPPPRSMSQPLLRRVLAFDVQLREAGGWPPGLAARLERAGRESRPKAPVPMSGGRLLREWNGVTHVVEITGEGYRWNGRDWRSLSAIARAITGAQWSGPRFFGLNATGQGGAVKRRRAAA